MTYRYFLKYMTFCRSGANRDSRLKTLLQSQNKYLLNFVGAVPTVIHA